MLDRYLNCFLIASCLVLFTAGAASAVDCDDDPNNEIANCGFDSDLTGWTAVNGTPVHSAAEGSPDLGAAVITANFEGRTWLQSACSNTDHIGDTTLRAARYRLVSGTPANCYVQIVSWESDGCTGGAEVVQTPSVVINGSWQTSSDSAVFQSTRDKSYYFDALCVGGDTDTVVAFDNAVFGSGAELPVQLQSMNVE